MLSINPLKGASFGAEATGVDIAQGLGDEVLKSLAEAVHEHRLLVIRGQRMSEDRYLGFGRWWGEPIPHVLDHLRMPGYPEMMAIGNHGGEWKENDAVRNGAAFWHTDQSYEAVPSSVTMLFSIKSPETGGETQLADLKSAYDELPGEMKQRLEGRRAWHLYGASSGEGDEAVANPLITNDQIARVPAVPHLIVRPHDITGRRTLYGVAGTPYAIEGMDEEEGTEILKELKRHVLQERFIYRHRYRVGDIAIYDTTQTLHSGTPIGPATDERNTRLLWRISVRGKPRAWH
ncbi:MAG: TauD/TfdA family dioxygenase [Immundisolibacterales bacterium]|nr:TauD/TfdA family dioxygenase [Immundisolibacterales bacterium]